MYVYMYKFVCIYEDVYVDVSVSLTVNLWKISCIVIYVLVGIHVCACV